MGISYADGAVRPTQRRRNAISGSRRSERLSGSRVDSKRTGERVTSVVRGRLNLVIDLHRVIALELRVIRQCVRRNLGSAMDPGVPVEVIRLVKQREVEEILVGATGGGRALARGGRLPA